MVIDVKLVHVGGGGGSSRAMIRSLENFLILALKYAKPMKVTTDTIKLIMATESRKMKENR